MTSHDDLAPWLVAEPQHDAHILAYLGHLEEEEEAADLDEYYYLYRPSREITDVLLSGNASGGGAGVSAHAREVLDKVRSGPRRPATPESRREALKRLLENEKKRGS